MWLGHEDLRTEHLLTVAMGCLGDLKDLSPGGTEVKGAQMRHLHKAEPRDMGWGCQKIRSTVGQARRLVGFEGLCTLFSGRWETFGG